MIRYYLFEKKADGSLQGKLTVIALQDDGVRMVLVSCISLHPNDFREIVLKDRNLGQISVVYESSYPIDGVNPPTAVEPFVCLVKRA